MSVRARRSGLARAIGPVWRNPGHAPLRRAIPLVRGTERVGSTGRPQRPTKVRGQSRVASHFVSRGAAMGGSVAHLSQNEPIEPGAAGSTTIPRILTKIQVWPSFSLIEQG